MVRTKWVCLKMLCTPKPNGFADHYPYEKWLFHWEYEPNIFRHTHITTRWCPSEANRVQLVNITPIKPMVYGIYNELVNGVYKPTTITGGHHPVWKMAQLDSLIYLFFEVGGFSTSQTVDITRPGTLGLRKKPYPKSSSRHDQEDLTIG